MTDYNHIKEKFQILMMGAIDGELDEKQQQEFESLLAEHPEFVQEYQEFQQLKEKTTAMKFKTPPDELWDTYWVDIYNRIERGIGWIFFSIGAMILLTYGGYKFFKAIIQDAQMPVIMKFGTFFLIGGLAVLLVSVARERMFTYKSDPYKEIKR